MNLFLLEEQIDRERRRSRRIFHEWVHCSNGRGGWRWTDWSKARGLLQFSHVGVVSKHFGPLPSAFPGHKQGVEWEMEQCVHELAPVGDAWRLLTVY